MPNVTVIGGGLAGVEATYQLARRGVAVRLIEGRPHIQSPAHKTEKLAELVCSNSLGSVAVGSGKGLLFAEMAALDSLVVAVGKQCAVPAGTALAVERSAFSSEIENRLAALPSVEIVRAEMTTIPTGPTIVATGPLTTDPLARELARLAGADHLYFYDATSPIIDGQTIDRTIAFAADRRGRGTGDYLNCPMNKEEYERFYRTLMQAELVTPHSFEDAQVFEGCMPIEQMARRGADTLRFGPMRPVGLIDPRTERRPWAVVQLRREDVGGDAWNLVGFQTRMTYGAQREVLRQIPGLAEARVLRFGVIHRNTYIDGPRALDETLAFRSNPQVRLAGQLTGVEGYLESAAMGLLAACHTFAELSGKKLSAPPPTTMLGALLRYVTTCEKTPIDPMNSNFGILPELAVHQRKKQERKAQLHERAMTDLVEWIDKLRG